MYMNEGNVCAMRKKAYHSLLFIDFHHLSAAFCHHNSVVENDRCVRTVLDLTLMLTVGQECFPLVDIDAGSGIRALTFSPDCEYVVCGVDKGIQVWRVEDGKQIVVKEVGTVTCLAVSKDGRWISAGTWQGHVIVWDTTTYEQASLEKKDVGIQAVDFSADSACLVSVGERTATVWNVNSRKHVQTLHHDGLVRAAKYGPYGHRIATVTEDCVRVWDDEHSFVDIPITMALSYDTSLFWSNENLFVVTDSKILQLDTSTRSTLSEWPAPNTNQRSRIALPQHGKFIASSTKRAVTFFDTPTRTRLGLIQHPEDILSIALSSDDRCIVIGGGEGKISIRSLSRITVCTLDQCGIAS